MECHALSSIKGFKGNNRSLKPGTVCDPRRIPLGLNANFEWDYLVVCKIIFVCVLLHAITHKVPHPIWTVCNLHVKEGGPSPPRDVSLASIKMLAKRKCSLEHRRTSCRVFLVVVIQPIWLECVLPLQMVETIYCSDISLKIYFLAKTSLF